MASYDKKINNLFYNWLLISFFLIFIMIVVGGLTRLTDSGLSITKWELFSGILPPLNQDTWNEYFSLYKNIPQYEAINMNMSLKEFKTIFYWEYFHRIIGRIIGIFFLVPLLYFYLIKKIDKRYLRYCHIVFVLIILQGIVGWYMVTSGLVNNTSVSHYRLSLHLSIAFIIISIIFWNLLNIKKNTFSSFFKNVKYNYFFYLLFFLMFSQVVMGAFVSGLDAGRIYQNWPLMGKYYFPDDIILIELKDFVDFNNHSLVQFYHRNIAYLILIYISLLGYLIFKKKLLNLFKPFYYVLFFLVLQILLGIVTLLSGLNIYLASAHQICSLLLILSIINLYYNYIN